MKNIIKKYEALESQISELNNLYWDAEDENEETEISNKLSDLERKQKVLTDEIIKEMVKNQIGTKKECQQIIIIHSKKVIQMLKTA